MNEFTTPVDATITEWQPSLDEFKSVCEHRDRLESQLQTMTNNWKYASDAKAELTQKIENVKGYMRDIYSEDGEIDERVTEIAELLDIELTKRIAGTATFEISWSAEVPIGFDADDFDISFDVDCESYEADNFEWNEDSRDISGEDE